MNRLNGDDPATRILAEFDGMVTASPTDAWKDATLGRLESLHRPSGHAAPRRALLLFAVLLILADLGSLLGLFGGAQRGTSNRDAGLEAVSSQLLTHVTSVEE